MGTEFTVDPDTFGPLAEQLRQAGNDLHSAWGPIMGQTQGVQFGRGDDVLSPLIQISLEGAVSLVDSCVTSSAEALSGYADGLDNMAKTFADVESDTTTMMSPS